MINNVIFESDNLDALKELLKMNLEEKVDVIPIDPPYNTAIYYIKYKDSFSDDYFIRFMKERLYIAYKLLSNKGVMFIHIDENELYNLKKLCEGIFGKENIKIIIWKKNNEIFDKDKKINKKNHNIKVIHEYIVVCFKDFINTKLNLIKKVKYDNGKFIEELSTLESIIDFLGTNFSAKKELSEIFDGNIVFSTPKPMKLIKELIRSASDKDSIILDFFGGSATTAHACMDLNKEDKGNRKFIIVTNNENNICRSVTVPRVEKAIKLYNYRETFEFKSLNSIYK